MTTFEELRKSKLTKLNELRAKGINPFPYHYARTHYSNEIHKEFGYLKDGEESGKKTKICGKIMGIRTFGKLAFLDVRDDKGKIQVQLKTPETTQAAWELLSLLDTGDFVGAEGTIIRTQRGEISVLAHNLIVLAKSLAPMPDKWHGISNIEARYRQRYLDLLMNPEVKQVFINRSKIIQSVRNTLEKNGFIEVETPLLQPQYGGANARPFKTYYHALDEEWYLAIASELYLKRLTIGNMERVYTISKDFRNEDIDKTHNPEFTMMECYWAYADYNNIMQLTEDIFRDACIAVHGKTEFTFQGKIFDVGKKWEKISLKKALKKYADIDADALSNDEMLEILQKNGKEMEGPKLRGLIINQLFETLAEKQLVNPTHLMDHPFETTPLCKEHRSEKGLIERFEGFINGWEIANGYSELNDPLKQRELLELQAKEGRAKGEQMPVDEEFLRAMEYGMPPQGGVGLGIDRMCMLLLNQPTIQDVIFFPALRTK